MAPPDDSNDSQTRGRLQSQTAAIKKWDIVVKFTQIENQECNERKETMNFNDLISVFCSLAIAFGISAGTYKAYKFVRHEVIMQCQRGLPSLEKFSRALTDAK